MPNKKPPVKQTKKKKEPKFEANEAKQESAFDDLLETKLGKKQKVAKASFGGLFAGFAGFAGLGLGKNSDDSSTDCSDGSLAAVNSDDDDTGRNFFEAHGRSPAARGTAARYGGAGGLGGLGGMFRGAKVNLEADLRTVAEPRAGEDLELPAGLEVKGLGGGEAKLAEQEDGAKALNLPEGSYLQASLRCSPFFLEDDGRMHEWTLVCAMRLDRLPRSGLSILSGGPAPAEGEKPAESIQVFKNGGVGALGHMGTQETAVRAERWAWIVLTRKKNLLTTYVNGQVCAEVTLTPARPPKEEGIKSGGGAKKGGGGTKGGEGGRGDADADDDEQEKDQKRSAEAKKREALLLERFCLSPEQFALFAPSQQARADACDKAGEGLDCGPERGLSIKYLRVTNEYWEAEQVSDEIHKLRNVDEEKDLVDEADADRANHLTLQPLYARPPPIWLHPAFAAEFGDAFIGGTSLEGGVMHVSLEVVCLAVNRMLKPDGTAAALTHRERAALNSANTLLVDAKKLAHKFAYAQEGSGQERLFLNTAIDDVEALDPGAALLIPCTISNTNLMFVVRRGLDDDDHLCTFTCVCCQLGSGGLGFHRAAAAPPKIKYETCLELRDVPLQRLTDGAFWAALWAATGMRDSAGQRYDPMTILYQVLFSFLADESLDVAMARSEELRRTERSTPEEAGTDPAPGAGEGHGGSQAPGDQLHTPRRSDSAHYGCIRHALSYLLRSSPTPR